jgi:DNA-binding NtrC family response regulator
MRKSMLNVLVLAGASLAVAEVASACSENVFRPGQGMAYRKLATAMPARVLIDADPASRGFAGARATELQQSFQEAGHTVRVITDARKLTEIVAKEPFDVVLTSPDNAEALAEAASKGRPAPAALPVLQHAAGSDAPSRHRFPHALSADASVRQALKAIERTMESRQR